MAEYKREQEQGTAEAMAESARALQYLERLWADKPKAKNSERARRTTLKSYLLQEAEAASREAKLRWCRENGVRVISLQHDGIVAMVRGSERTQQVADSMAASATAACGYGVKVIPKEAAVLVA